MNIEVEIKTKHFRNSWGYVDPNNCPLAMAIKDKLELSGDDVGVSMGSARIQDKRYRVPSEWCHNQKVYDGKWKDINIDKIIKMVKEDKSLELPTITLTLTER